MWRWPMAAVYVVLALCSARPCAAQSIATPDARRTDQTAVAASAVDVFRGRDNAGPYLLTWKRVHRRSEVVTVGGSMLLRDVDYTLDAETGVLVFASPLRTGHSARVSYSFTPGTALPNPPPPAAPTQLRLAAWDRSSVALGVVLPRGMGAVSGNGGMLLTLDAGAQNVPGPTARMVVDPAAAHVADAAALRLGQSVQLGTAQVSASLVRAGAEFRGAAADGVAGRQTVDARGVWRVARGIEATASMVETTDGVGQKSWTTVRTIGQTLTASLPSGTRMIASLTASSRDGSAGAGVAATAGRLSLDQTFGARTRLAVQWDRSVQRSGEALTETAGSSVLLQGQISPGVTLRGAASERRLADGLEGNRSLAVDAQPGGRLRVSATAEERSGPAGATERQGVRVEGSPGGGVRLTASAEDLRSADDVTRARNIGLGYAGRRGFEVGADFGVRLRGEGSESLGTARAAWRPGPALALMGEARLRGIGSDPSADSSYHVRMASELARGALRVAGSYAVRPESAALGVARPERAASVDLASRLGALDLAGRYSLVAARGDAGDVAALDLSLGWRFGAGTRVAGGYRTAIDRLHETDSYTMSLSHHLGSHLDLTVSGSWTRRDHGALTPGPADYRADARLGLRF
ncbi:MAG TPA: hypothetical protein VLH79_08260 [Chthonomonadales bacterium]|nr:hypothetical protein [Chthonomonadales bacterium]